MSSDTSLPRRPEQGPSSDPEPEPAPGARVLDFPSEEVSSPGKPVPAGTWATPDQPADASQSTERPLRRTRREGDVAQVVKFPKQPVTQRRRRVEAPRDAEPPAPPSYEEPTAAPMEETDLDFSVPKYLASELLKVDWHPREPLKRTTRWTAVILGSLTAVAALALGGLERMPLVLAGIGAGCAVAGALPMPARVRGILLALLAVSGAAIAGWLRMVEGLDPSSAIVGGCVTLSAGALFFRAEHRLSKLARGMVAVGLASLTGWLALTGGVEALIVDGLDWQEWVAPALRALLGLIVLASMLSFLDPSGRGGAAIAGAALLVWLALEGAARVALASWPVRGGGSVDLSQPDQLATLMLPLLAAIAAGGLCQLAVMFSRPSRARRELSRTTIA
jgi:hypothetical protein